MTISNKIELRIKALEARLVEHEGGSIAAWEQVSKDVKQFKQDVAEILNLLRDRAPASAD